MPTTNLVETLKARWIAKRNEYISAARKGRPLKVPGVFYQGPDAYARRELRAYRLAQVWARDKTLPGEWYWVSRDQRWDVYPGREARTLMRVVRHGTWVELFYPDGTEARTSYILNHPA